MAIKLEWVNNTPGNFITEIYRSDTTFTSANKPATPLVTLTAGESMYTDPTAAQGKWYYYMWATYDTARTKVAYSAVVRLQAIEYTGPGGTSLLWGDTEYGFYGYLSTSSLPGLRDLLTANGRSGVASAISAGNQNWHKWAYKGKILFVTYGLAVTCSWDTLYANGMVYGDVNQDTILGAPSGDARVNSVMKLKTGAGDQFIARLLRGYSSDLSAMPDFSTLPATISGAKTAAPLRDCEYDRLILGSGGATPVNSPTLLTQEATRWVAAQCAEADATLKTCYVRGSESYFNTDSDEYRRSAYCRPTSANESTLSTPIVLELVRS
ncbi:hypothetical protein EOM33_06440 [Candidatus Saccharibacteria bacterium]|nr:hypothetical protein [Candidatus Saccharibacteria bacterium]